MTQMTQQQMLKVEYQELMARADEIEAPIPEPLGPWNPQRRNGCGRRGHGADGSAR